MSDKYSFLLIFFYVCKVHFAVSKFAAFYDDPTMDFTGNFMIFSINVYLTLT